MIVIKNKLACKKCGNIIESTSVHDMQWCLCGAIAVDGGYDYARWCGEQEDMIDMSQFATKVKRFLIGTPDLDGDKWLSIMQQLWALIGVPDGKGLCTRVKWLEDRLCVFVEVYIPA